MKGHCKCERHRLYSWHQQSVRCPSVFTAIKRSERCPDILCTSGAHIPPPARSWKCYCNWDASWTGPSMTQEVCILNGVSMRFGAAWPFSDGLNVKYVPLRVKRKGASAVFLSSMELYWMGEWEKEGQLFLVRFLYRMSDKIVIKSPRISQPWKAKSCLFLSSFTKTGLSVQIQ